MAQIKTEIISQKSAAEHCYDYLSDLIPMSEEQLKAFLKKVKGDSRLQEKLKAAADVDAVLAIAKEAGFMISADDVRRELSEKELEGVAGGRFTFCGITGNCNLYSHC